MQKSNELKKSLSIEQIFNLLVEFNANPNYINNKTAIVADTICHNPAGEGSHKLYYYDNTKLFKCYTNCDFFDIFELYIKIKKVREDKDISLPQSIKFIINYFNLSIDISQEEYILEDWRIINNYDRIKEILEGEKPTVSLKIYDSKILNNFNQVTIEPWLKEGISQEALNINQIGYYPKEHQITIPHWDENNRLVGIRGRTLIKENADLYGKYRPLKVNGFLYTHPLSFNLYNLNFAKDNITKIQKAMVFESEKSCLLYKTYFGKENDISVATCGNHISDYQMDLLFKYGVKEICFAFDKDFHEIGDEDFIRLKKLLLKIHNKYHALVKISFLFDKFDLTDYKSSPIDHGKEVFLELFKKRILL